MTYEVKKEFETKEGYKAVILFTRDMHHCGYIGVEKSHPFYGKSYDDRSGINKSFMKDRVVGKRSPIDLLIYRMEKEDDVSVGYLFDVHGGVTYADGGDNYPIKLKDIWWFGFDCAHLGDKNLNDDFPGDTESTFKDVDYCVDELINFSKQMKQFDHKLKLLKEQ